MPEPKDVAVYVSIVAPIVTWSLVIGGWLFVRSDNNKRENRREIRSILDAIIKEIKDLEDSGWDYYQKPSDDPEAIKLGVSMKRNKALLEDRIGHLAKTTGRFTSLEKLSKFGDELTGGDYEQNSRQVRTIKDRKFLEISTAANDLITYLEDEYRYFVPANR